MTWDPSKWIEVPSKQSWNIESEKLAPDTSDKYLPWATDHHICPGKQFSQVEFVAVIAALFCNYQVAPATKIGESLHEARLRIMGLAQDIQSKELLNEIRNPEKIGLNWTRYLPVS